MPNLDAEEKRKREILERLARGPREWQPITLDENDLERMKAGPSSYEDIRTDPALRAARMEAIDRFGDMADGGYTVAEEAAMQRARTEANRDDASRRAAISQQMQMRGGGGGGAELAMQLASADSAAERENQSALDIAARGQQRSLEALRQRGAMAASLSDDDYQQQARAAEARDQISRFNSGLMQGFLRDRNNTQNEAGRWNAGQGNDWEWKNAEVQYNDVTAQENRKIQEEEKRKRAKRDRMAGNLGALGTVAGGVAGGIYGGPGGAMTGAQAGGALGSGLGGMLSDERRKSNISELSSDDIDEFLASLSGKEFDYDDGPSNRVGVMAQDIEKTPIGDRVVRDTDEGKVLDEHNLLGAILASLGRLEKKKRNNV